MTTITRNYPQIEDDDLEQHIQDTPIPQHSRFTCSSDVLFSNGEHFLLEDGSWQRK